MAAVQVMSFVLPVLLDGAEHPQASEAAKVLAQLLSNGWQIAAGGAVTQAVVEPPKEEGGTPTQHWMILQVLTLTTIPSPIALPTHLTRPIKAGKH